MRLPSALDLLAKTPILCLTGALCLLIPLTMAGTLAPLGGTAGLVEIQLTPDAETYTEIVRAWGPAGRQGLAQHFSGDFIYMLAYALCGLGLLHRLARPRHPSSAAAQSAPGQSPPGVLQRLAAHLVPLPAAIAVTDLAETLFHGLLLANWESPSTTLVTLAFGLNVIKWSLAGILLLLLLMLVSARAARAARSPQS
jgi:hypothetical protein